CLFGIYVQLNKSDVRRITQHTIDVFERAFARRALVTMEVSIRKRNRQRWTERRMIGPFFASGVDRLVGEFGCASGTYRFVRHSGIDGLSLDMPGIWPQSRKDVADRKGESDETCSYLQPPKCNSPPGNSCAVSRACFPRTLLSRCLLPALLNSFPLEP